jgi:hypothetical protein
MSPSSELTRRHTPTPPLEHEVNDTVHIASQNTSMRKIGNSSNPLAFMSPSDIISINSGYTVVSSLLLSFEINHSELLHLVNSVSDSMCLSNVPI